MSEAVALVVALGSARKAIQLYPETHPTYRQTIEELVAAATTAVGAEGLALNLHEGRLYVGSEVITEESPALTSIADAMGARRIGSMVFETGFGERDAAGLAEALNLRPSPELDVAAELESRGVAHVRVSAVTDEDAEEREARDRRRQEDRSMYRRTASLLRQLSQKMERGDPVALAEASPVVQGIMSRLFEDEAAVLGMATINAGSELELLHAINVMIYTLNLGASLKIPEDGLLSLGISALVHDIGKVAFDKDDPEQARAAEVMHPTVGADLLSRLPDEEDQTPMLVAYEHHMCADGSGYPEREAGYVAHPYSRMVAVANRYDHLTKKGLDGEPMHPDRAVMQILVEAGISLDPFFVRLFVKSLGVFPIGCVVRLSDHSAGVVSRRGADPLDPTVRVVFGPDGRELDEPADVDLADDERSIVEVLDPESLGLTVAEVL